MKHSPFYIALGYAMVLACMVLTAQVPSPPSQPQAASGTITVLVNGVPIATGGTINLKSGTGVIASASPDPSINGTDISFSADTAVMLSNAADQAGIDRAIVATSNYPNPAPFSPSDGLHYIATTNPTLTVYTPGQAFVMIPDVPSLAGATLNIGGIGPIAIQGTCSQICILLASGTPVSSLVVH